LYTVAHLRLDRSRTALHVDMALHIAIRVEMLRLVLLVPAPIRSTKRDQALVQGLDGFGLIRIAMDALPGPPGFLASVRRATNTFGPTPPAVSNAAAMATTAPSGGLDLFPSAASKAAKLRWAGPPVRRRRDSDANQVGAATHATAKARPATTNHVRVL
jgi:hypothetical protein